MREAVSVVRVGKSSMPKFLATREPTVGARTIGDLALPYSVRICFVLKALPMAAFLLIFEMPAASGSEHDQMPEVPAPSSNLDFSQPASVGVSRT